ncbi:hypothetical protein PR048_004503 [Dryococelus australis]|uniref:Uncharacterized protein n=1 Tax=Dryococelus australis TaxID=614101 RepID=A0ABQ9I5M0_9NEOP|nr:hypothetical protein PR048_004503 [Dryococelus australis]
MFGTGKNSATRGAVFQKHGAVPCFLISDRRQFPCNFLFNYGNVQRCGDGKPLNDYNVALRTLFASAGGIVTRRGANENDRVLHTALSQNDEAPPPSGVQYLGIVIANVRHSRLLTPFYVCIPRTCGDTSVPCLRALPRRDVTNEHAILEKARHNPHKGRRCLSEQVMSDQRRQESITPKQATNAVPLRQNRLQHYSLKMPSSITPKQATNAVPLRQNRLQHYSLKRPSVSLRASNEQPTTARVNHAQTSHKRCPSATKQTTALQPEKAVGVSPSNQSRPNKPQTLSLAAEEANKPIALSGHTQDYEQIEKLQEHAVANQDQGPFLQPRAATQENGYAHATGNATLFGLCVLLYSVTQAADHQWYVDHSLVTTGVSRATEQAHTSNKAIASPIYCHTPEQGCRVLWNSAGMKGRVKTGDPRENPPTCCIVRHVSHMRKSGSDHAGNRARITKVGDTLSNRYTTAAPARL